MVPLQYNIVGAVKVKEVFVGEKWGGAWRMRPKAEFGCEQGYMKLAGGSPT